MRRISRGLFLQTGTSLSAVLGVLLLAWVLLLGLAGTEALAQFQQTEDHGGTSGSCRCGEDLCGCARPLAGCTLSASCSCPSSGECTQSCTYNCK